MPLPGVKTKITEYTHKPIDRKAIEAAEKQNGEYLKGRFKVSMENKDKLDANLIKLWAVEKKIEEILSHPEYTHLQLWNEIKFIYTRLLENNIPKSEENYQKME